MLPTTMKSASMMPNGLTGPVLVQEFHVMIQDGWNTPILLLDWLSFFFAFDVMILIHWIVITSRVRNYLITTVLDAFNQT